MDKNIPGIRGVYLLDEPLAGHIGVISIKQMYGGHAKQVALASAGSNYLAYLCNWIIIVDDDIDPSNISEVLWALATRGDPVESIDFARGCWGSMLDPNLSTEKKKQGLLTHSTAIVLACKPYHRIDEWPKTYKLTPEQLAEVKNKWGKFF